MGASLAWANDWPNCADLWAHTIRRRGYPMIAIYGSQLRPCNTGLRV